MLSTTSKTLVIYLVVFLIYEDLPFLGGTQIPCGQMAALFDMEKTFTELTECTIVPNQET